jgi:hypothetical protein
MIACQIYNTPQASNSQQVLLYSNRSLVIIVLVRESRTKAPAREREREQRRAASAQAKKTRKQKKRNRRQFLQCALVLPRKREEVLNVLYGSSQRSLWKLTRFFLEAPNVLCRSFQRSFSTLRVFVRSRGSYFASAFPHCSLPTFFLEVPSILSRHSDQRSSLWDDRNVLSGRSPSFSVRVDLNFAVTFPLRSLYVPPSSPVQVPNNRSP